MGRSATTTVLFTDVVGSTEQTVDGLVVVFQALFPERLTGAVLTTALVDEWSTIADVHP